MSKMKYIPMGLRVLVKEHAVTEKTEGGIIVTESKAHTSFVKVDVLAVGDEVVKFKAGDKGLIEKDAGVPMVVNGEECKVVMQSDVAFTLEAEAE